MLVYEILGNAIKELESVGIVDARLDAELLLGHCLKKSRTELYIASQTSVGASQLNHFNTILLRRKKHEPIAYILGEREFWSLSFFVDKRVLIPRPETEFLLDVILSSEVAGEFGPILDLCCGSGVIGVVLAHELGLPVIACDISVEALELAQKNCSHHGLDHLVTFLKSDLFSEIKPLQQFSLIVSNPPYVCVEDIALLEPEVKQYEPHLALDGGDDGLKIIRSIREKVPKFLLPGGWIFMEIGADQGKSVIEIFQDQNLNGAFHSIEVKKDYAGRDRVLKARLME